MRVMRASLSVWRWFHRWTGRVAALLFAGWFISGLVLIYHPYPRLDDAEVYARMPLLADSVAPAADASEVARRWLEAPIERVDTLMERSQWVLSSRFEDDFPVYRFYYADKERHELFVSGSSLRPIQYTSRTDRIWSYFGAIPHKVYIPALRRDTATWKVVMTTGGALCLAAALSGLVAGIGLLRLHHRRTGKWRNPFRRGAWRWHFALGLCIGALLVTWGLSGTYSVQKVPEWVASSKNDFTLSARKFWGKTEAADSLWLFTEEVASRHFGRLKAYERLTFGGYPAVRVVNADSAVLLCGDDSVPVPLVIPRAVVERRLGKLCGDSVAYSIELMKNYDQYYMPRLRGQADLPVYKATLHAPGNPTIYIDPADGYVRLITDRKRARKWVFEGMHYLNINHFYTCRPLWTACIWLLCGCGAAVCLTGAWITAGKVRRRLLHRRHPKIA